MKLSSLTLAAALAFAGTAAMADTTVHRVTQVGPNGEVTHVTKRVEAPDGSTRTVHKVRRVTTTTQPVVVHRHVAYQAPHHHRHHHHMAYRHDNGRHLAYGHRDHEGRHLAYGHRDHDREVIVHREVVRRNG